MVPSLRSHFRLLGVVLVERYSGFALSSFDADPVEHRNLGNGDLLRETYQFSIRSKKLEKVLTYHVLVDMVFSTYPHIEVNFGNPVAGHRQGFIGGGLDVSPLNDLTPSEVSTVLKTVMEIVRHHVIGLRSDGNPATDIFSRSIVFTAFDDGKLRARSGVYEKLARRFANLLLPKDAGESWSVNVSEDVGKTGFNVVSSLYADALIKSGPLTGEGEYDVG